MDQKRMKELKKRIAEIHKQSDEWAKTPEGREFDLRMVFVYNVLKVGYWVLWPSKRRCGAGNGLIRGDRSGEVFGIPE